jgi:hypothetical protein
MATSDLPTADDFQNRSHGALTLQQKKLYVIVPMDFHPFLADADTLLERFDEESIFIRARPPPSCMRVACGEVVRWQR